MTTRQQIDVPITFPDSIFTGNRTYSSLFLAPAFDLDFYGEAYDFFVNAYIQDREVHTAFKRPLFLLLETNEISDKFKRVHQELIANKNFVYTYCAGSFENRLLYMYVFECPDEFRDDYDKFLKGAYSKFSPKYKGCFIRLVQDVHGDFIESPLFGAIYKTRYFKKKVESLLFEPGEFLDKDQEYFGVPSRKIEVFRQIQDNYALKD
jgi:hypothetical protein